MTYLDTNAVSWFNVSSQIYEIISIYTKVTDVLFSSKKIHRIFVCLMKRYKPSI